MPNLFPLQRVPCNSVLNFYELNGCSFFAYNTISFRFSIFMRLIYIVGRDYYSKNPQLRTWPLRTC